MLLRLTSLQQFQQASHLAISDELLNFFLQESSTTGAGGDADVRKRIRMEARKRVGFDPYDESPIKHHGESYQYENQYDADYDYDDDVHGTAENSKFSGKSEPGKTLLNRRASAEPSSEDRTPGSDVQSDRSERGGTANFSPLVERNARRQDLSAQRVLRTRKVESSPLALQSTLTEGLSVTSNS